MEEKFFVYVFDAPKDSVKRQWVSSKDVYRLLEETDSTVIRPSTNQQAIIVSTREGEELMWYDIGTDANS